MAANISDTWAWVIAALDAAGLRAVDDPRNVQPPCVLVDPPSVIANQSQTLVQLQFPISVIAPPPGNRDAMMWMLDAVDDVIGALPISNGDPGSYNLGGTDLPSYNLTATIQIRRQ